MLDGIIVSSVDPGTKAHGDGTMSGMAKGISGLWANEKAPREEVHATCYQGQWGFG